MLILRFMLIYLCDEKSQQKALRKSFFWKNFSSCTIWGQFCASFTIYWHSNSYVFHNQKHNLNHGSWFGFTLESQRLYVRIATPLRWNRDAIRLLSRPDFMLFLAKIGLKVPFLTLQSLRSRSRWCALQVLKSCYNSLHFPDNKAACFISVFSKWYHESPKI